MSIVPQVLAATVLLGVRQHVNSIAMRILEPACSNPSFHGDVKESVHPCLLPAGMGATFMRVDCQMTMAVCACSSSYKRQRRVDTAERSAAVADW